MEKQRPRAPEHGEPQPRRRAAAPAPKALRSSRATTRSLCQTGPGHRGREKWGDAVLPTLLSHTTGRRRFPHPSRAASPSGKGFQPLSSYSRSRPQPLEPSADCPPPAAGEGVREPRPGPAGEEPGERRSRRWARGLRARAPSFPAHPLGSWGGVRWACGDGVPPGSLLYTANREESTQLLPCTGCAHGARAKGGGKHSPMKKENRPGSRSCQL